MVEQIFVGSFECVCELVLDVFLCTTHFLAVLRGVHSQRVFLVKQLN